MKQKTVNSTLALAILLFSSKGALAIDEGTMLGNTCAGCHGTNGSSVGPATPNIAGISKDTMVEAMKDYASNKRKSTIMGRIARGYTDKQIEAMADFFTKQKLQLRPQETDAAKVKVGAKLHDEYCEKCHEDGGRKDEDGSSILAGQWMPYLKYSFDDYDLGSREMSKKMKKKVESMVKEHGKESIDQIVHFYASQK